VEEEKIENCLVSHTFLVRETEKLNNLYNFDLEKQLSKRNYETRL